MIRNVIFDMGNVLIHFDGEEIMKPFVDKAEDRRLILRELFETGDWIQLDYGTLREAELAELVAPRLPTHLQQPLRNMLNGWYNHLTLSDQSYYLVEELKEKGYGVYLLSNASHSLEEEYRHHVPAIGLMDGRLISALEGVIKPEDAIYKRLFEKFALQPAECFFIDDMPQNIEGSRKNGMEGHVFDGDDAALRQALGKAGVDICYKTTLVPVKNKEQVACLTALADEIWTEHYTPIIGKAQVEYMLATYHSPEAIQREVEEGIYQYYLLCDEGNPVGYVSFALQADVLFLSKIYLQKGSRGKGIAKVAIAFLQSVARHREKSAITLTVNRYNVHSLAAYQKMGFEIVEETVTDIGGGFVMDDYICRLRTASAGVSD